MKNKIHNDTLTRREVEILYLICDEFTPADISEKLGISEKTFFNHRANILEKIRARTNIGVFRHAIRHGYINFSSLLAA